MEAAAAPRSPAGTDTRRLTGLVPAAVQGPGANRAACAIHKGDGPRPTNSQEMESRRPTHRNLKSPSAAGVRPAGLLNARTAGGLRAIIRRARGLTCDVRAVVLDDQSGKLHVPLLETVDRRSPSGRVAAGELIVRRVEEFQIEGPVRTRWFELGGLAYEPDARRVSIGPDGRSQFALTVESLDVTLRIRPQARPRS